MYIQQLVIEGFKSYKDRVTIQFHPGLNVVIGKNGAGKSNVFAAIEFVLSNKYSSLRAEDRQRLLHEGSGSSSSQQLAAEVEITFNNEDRRFPEDKDIVTLKRVIGLKKDEFLLNNRHVSKSQVDNLLESAGFSRSNPYNIVQQGKVNALLKMTDAMRLDLLKEIAGTRVYDKRRAESLKIMHTTDACRAQIDEISESLEKRLQELENEQEELRQFQELDKERRSLEFTVFTLEQNSADRKLSALEEDRERAHQNAEEAHKAAESIQEEQSSLEAELSDLKTSLADLEGQRQKITSRLEKITKKCAHQTMIVRGDEEAAIQGTNEAEKVKADIAALQKKIVQTEHDLGRLESVYTAEKTQEQTVQNELNHCRARVEELYSKQGRKTQFKSKADRDKYLQKEIAHCSQLLAQEKHQAESGRNSILEKEKKLQSLVENRDRVSSEITNDAKELHQISEKLVELKDTRDSLNNDRKECWRLQSQHDAKVAQLRNRLQETESKLYSNMPRDVRTGLQTIKELCTQHNITGVYGMLCELFTTEPTFYQAVQTTAGNRLFHVVVDSDETASKILEAMRRARAGRVTFMPLNRLNQESNSLYVESADAIPMISKLVFKPMFKPAMIQVFGKTVIARNLDVGAVYSREHGMNAITLDGDQVNKKGAMVGGYVDTRSSALKTMAELFDIRAEIESSPDIEGLRNEAKVKDQEVTLVLGEMSKLESQKRFLRERVNSRKDELNMMISEIKIITADIVSKKQSVEQYQLDISQTSAKIEAFQRELQGDFSSTLTSTEQAELESLQNKTTDLESRLLKLSKKRASAQADLSSLSDLLNLNYRVQLKDLQDSLSSAAIESDDVAEHLAELRRLQSSEARCRTELDQNQEQIAEIQSRVQQLSTDIDALKERETLITSDLAAHSRRMEKLVNRRSLLLQKKDDCIRNIRQLGALPSGAFEKFGDKSINDLMTLLKKCNEKLKKYNHVNKKAIDQFLNFTEQRTRLRERKIELDKGKKAIEDCIAHLDHQKDEAIRRTFKSIAKNFSKVFSELIPGGKATLVIQTGKKSPNDSVADESDEDAEHERREHRILDNDTTDRYCGVGIKVSFSGEGNVFSMTQLSGGQQTVVALCLVFAIQRCDPFPFYLFDEIDSALDSAHRSSIARMIGKRSAAARSEETPVEDDQDAMRDEDEDEGDQAVSKIRQDESKQTQFICTTFRPEMLEYADKCFGVYYTNKVSRVQDIDVETARSILDSNERDVGEKE